MQPDVKLRIGETKQKLTAARVCIPTLNDFTVQNTTGRPFQQHQQGAAVISVAQCAWIWSPLEAPKKSTRK